MATSRSPSHLSQRLDRHDGLHLGGEGVVQLGLLDGQPVAVRGDHAQLAAEDRHEHTGEDGPRLVARSCAADLVERLHEGLAADHERAAHVEGGRLREVAGRPRVERELGAAGRHLGHSLGGFNDHLFAGQVADDIAQEPRRHDDLTLLLDRGGHGRLDGDLHVGGEEVEASFGGLQEDAREDGQGKASGHTAGEDREFVDQHRAITRELHPDSL
jgi:hypothetical protein